MLAGSRSASTAEQLMRSRYSAFVVGDADYLLDTWHPATRPDRIDLDDRLRWTGLRILATEAGGAEDARGIVEFAADHVLTTPDGGEQAGTLHETSRFSRQSGRWLYVRGRLHDEGALG
ncbi:YchJ family metal-binding protein [Nocardioides sp. GY 10113]|uniref:YchJ family protein n=1 Tax=Nocardioides sp. GY 10113 TaxID=2569761 RepID=UPI001F0ED3D0|nr:YchJ family metal-binding protein [Nocardioides sp. GY 10113]